MNLMEFAEKFDKNYHVISPNYPELIAKREAELEDLEVEWDMHTCPSTFGVCGGCGYCEEMSMKTDGLQSEIRNLELDFQAEKELRG